MSKLFYTIVQWEFMAGISLFINPVNMNIWQIIVMSSCVLGLAMSSWTDGYDRGSEMATCFWKDKWEDAMEVIRSL